MNFRRASVEGELLGSAASGAGNVVHLRVDVVVNAIHARANVRDGDHCDQRDESRKQGVLDQVLAFLFANEPFQQSFHRTHSSRGEGNKFAANFAWSSARMSDLVAAHSASAVGLRALQSS